MQRIHEELDRLRTASEVEESDFESMLAVLIPTTLDNEHITKEPLKVWLVKE